MPRLHGDATGIEVGRLKKLWTLSLILVVVVGGWLRFVSLRTPRSRFPYGPLRPEILAQVPWAPCALSILPLIALYFL